MGRFDHKKVTSAWTIGLFLALFFSFIFSVTVYADNPDWGKLLEQRRVITGAGIDYPVWYDLKQGRAAIGEGPATRWFVLKNGSWQAEGAQSDWTNKAAQKYLPRLTDEGDFYKVDNIRKSMWGDGKYDYVFSKNPDGSVGEPLGQVDRYNGENLKLYSSNSQVALYGGNTLGTLHKKVTGTFVIDDKTYEIQDGKVTDGQGVTVGNFNSNEKKIYLNNGTRIDTTDDNKWVVTGSDGETKSYLTKFKSGNHRAMEYQDEWKENTQQIVDESGAIVGYKQTEDANGKTYEWYFDRDKKPVLDKKSLFSGGSADSSASTPSNNPPNDSSGSGPDVSSPTAPVSDPDNVTQVEYNQKNGTLTIEGGDYKGTYSWDSEKQQFVREIKKSNLNADGTGTEVTDSKAFSSVENNPNFTSDQKKTIADAVKNEIQKNDYQDVKIESGKKEITLTTKGGKTEKYTYDYTQEKWLDKQGKELNLDSNRLTSKQKEALNTHTEELNQGKVVGDGGEIKITQKEKETTWNWDAKEGKWKNGNEYKTSQELKDNYKIPKDDIAEREAGLKKQQEKFQSEGWTEEDAQKMVGMKTKDAAQYQNSRQISSFKADDKGNYTLTRGSGKETETWNKVEGKDAYQMVDKNGKAVGEEVDGGTFRKQVLNKAYNKDGNVKYNEVYKNPSTYHIDEKTGKVYDAADWDSEAKGPKKGAQEIGNYDKEKGEITWKDKSKTDAVDKKEVKTVITNNAAQYVLLVLESLEGRKTKKTSKKVKVKASELQDSQGAQTANTVLLIPSDEANGNTPIEATTIAGASNAMIQLLNMTTVDLSLLSESNTTPKTTSPSSKPTVITVQNGGKGVAMGSAAVSGSTFASANNSIPVVTTTFVETVVPGKISVVQNGGNETNEKQKEIAKRRSLLMAEWAVAATNIGEGSNAISNQFYERAQLFVDAANAAQGSLGGASAINDTDRFVLFELTRGAALSAVQLGLKSSMTLNELEAKN